MKNIGPTAQLSSLSDGGTVIVDPHTPWSQQEDTNPIDDTGPIELEHLPPVMTNEPSETFEPGATVRIAAPTPMAPTEVLDLKPCPYPGMLGRHPGVLLANLGRIPVVFWRRGAQDGQVSIEQQASIDVRRVGLVVLGQQNQLPDPAAGVFGHAQVAQHRVGMGSALLLVIGAAWVVDDIVKKGGQEEGGPGARHSPGLEQAAHHGVQVFLCVVMPVRLGITGQQVGEGTVACLDRHVEGE